MFKTFEIAEKKEKKFRKFIKSFNKILNANGFHDLKTVLIGKIDIPFHIVRRNDTINIFLSGHKYVVEIPDEILNIKDYEYLGAYYKIDGSWMRFLKNDKNIQDSLYVNERNFRCDHCGKNIQNRKAYYFFKKGKNYTVVGSGCANAFFGYNVENIFEKLSETTEYESNSYEYSEADREIISWDAITVAKAVKYFTSGFGRWNKKSNDGSGTVTKVKEYFFNLMSGKDVDLINEKITEQEYDMICNYWKNRIAISDIDKNASESMKLKTISYRWLGFFAWGVFKGAKETAVEREKNKSNQITGSFVSAIGKRETMVLESVKSSHYTPSVANMIYACRNRIASRLHFVDDNGNNYVCFCNSGKTINYIENNIGKKIRLCFTIVKHETNYSKNINIINRIKVVED